jgi:hypothetical protein
VIGQLETSLSGSLTNVSIELSGVDGIEFAPFPIPPISAAVAQTVFGGCQSTLGQTRILVSGDFVGERIDEVVESREADGGEEVLKALFAYETIKNSEASLRQDRTLRAKIIQLSIESGVLCGETAFVGFSNEVFRIQPVFDSSPMQRRAGGALYSAAMSPTVTPSLCQPSMPCCAARPHPAPQCAAPPCSVRRCAAPPCSVPWCAAPPCSVRRCAAPPTSASPVKAGDPMLVLIGLQKVEGL